ncbi:MAG: hypothetical protein GY941_16215 [Planctomycetes bacterium]|nr:hypothetical protein [Planctomycetota bacterium]
MKELIAKVEDEALRAELIKGFDAYKTEHNKTAQETREGLEAQLETEKKSIETLTGELDKLKSATPKDPNQELVDRLAIVEASLKESNEKATAEATARAEAEQNVIWGESKTALSQELAKKGCIVPDLITKQYYKDFRKNGDTFVTGEDENIANTSQWTDKLIESNPEYFGAIGNGGSGGSGNGATPKKEVKKDNSIASSVNRAWGVEK